MYSTYDQYEVSPDKPDNLDEMLEVARKLSKAFKYVRVDLYEIDGNVKFGEMTFTPMSGCGKWEKQNENILVGDCIDLFTKKENIGPLKENYTLNEWIDHIYKI